MGGIGGLFEGWLMGDSKFGKHLKEQYWRGQDDEAFGRKLTNEGLSGLRGLDREYSSLLADPNGPLPEYVKSAIRASRGRVADNRVRSDRSFAARVQEMARTSGGDVSEGAQLELALENEKNTQEGAFNALRDIDMGEASLSLDETNKLRDRVGNIRQTILGAGMTKEQQAVLRQLASLEGRYKRNKAISDALFQALSMFGGGAAGGV